MTGLKILAGVVFLLILLGMARLGGEIKYSQEGICVHLRFGFFSFQVYPREKKKKESAPKRQKPEKEKPEKEPETEHGGPLEQVKQFLPLVCEAAGELKRKIQIDRLILELTVAAGDAARTAMAYGYANMAVGMLWPLLEQNFEIKDPQIRTGVDFNAGATSIYINAAVSLRLGQLISFALRFGWKFLRAYQKAKPPRKITERGDLT